MSILLISLSSPHLLHRLLRLPSPPRQSSSRSSSSSSSLVNYLLETSSLCPLNLPSSSSISLPSSSSSSSSSSLSSFYSLSSSSSSLGFFSSLRSISSSSLNPRDFSSSSPSLLSSLSPPPRISQQFLSLHRKWRAKTYASAAARKLSSSSSVRQERQEEEEERGHKERKEKEREEEASEEKEEGDVRVPAEREAQEGKLHRPVLELHQNFSQSRKLAKEKDDGSKQHPEPPKKKKKEKKQADVLKSCSSAKNPSLSSGTFLASDDQKTRQEEEEEEQEEILQLGFSILQNFFDCTPSQWLDALRRLASICPQNRFGHEHRYRWRQETQSKIQLAKLDAYEWEEKRRKKKKKKRWTGEIEGEHEDENKKEKEISSSSSSSFSPYRKLTGKWKKGEEKQRRKDREKKEERNSREEHNSLDSTCLKTHGEGGSSSLPPSSSSLFPSSSSSSSLFSSSSSLFPSSSSSFSAPASSLGLPLLLFGELPVECLLWRSSRFLPHLTSRQLVQFIEVAERLHFHDGRNLYHPSACTSTSLSHLSSSSSSLFSLPSSSLSPLPDLRTVLLGEVMARLTQHTETCENKEEEEEEREEGQFITSPSSASSSKPRCDSSSTCRESREGSHYSSGDRRRRGGRKESVSVFSLREIHIIVKYFASHVPAEIAGVLASQGAKPLLGEKERVERPERDEVLNGCRLLGGQREEEGEEKEEEEERRGKTGRMHRERVRELERERLLSDFRMEDLLKSPEGKVFVIRQELACLFRLLLQSAISQLARLSEKKNHRSIPKDRYTPSTRDLQEKKERADSRHVPLSAHRVRKRERHTQNPSKLSPLEQQPSPPLASTLSNTTPDIVDHHGLSSSSSSSSCPSSLSCVASRLSPSSSSCCSSIERREATSLRSAGSSRPPFHENTVVPLLEACGKLQLVHLKPDYLDLLSLSYSSFSQSKSLLNIAKAFQFAAKVEIPIDDLIAQKEGIHYQLLQRLSASSEFFSLLHQERSPSAAQVALGQLAISMLYFLDSTRQSMMKLLLSQQEEQEKRKARDFYTHLLRLQEDILYHILESVYLYVHWERMLLSSQLYRTSTRRRGREGDEERERKKEGMPSEDDLSNTRGCTPAESMKNSRLRGGEEEERDSDCQERLPCLDSQTEARKKQKKKMESESASEEKRRKTERIMMSVLENRKEKEKIAKKRKDLGELSPFLHRQIQTVAVAISLENPFLSSRLQRQHENEEEEEDQDKEEEEERREKEAKEEEECRDKNVNVVREEKDLQKPVSSITEKKAKKKKKRSSGLSTGDMLYILLDVAEPQDCVYIQKESSLHHSNISATLRSLGVGHQVEVSRDPYVVDLLLSARNACIEVDGPLHFLAPPPSSSSSSCSLSSSSSFAASKSTESLVLDSVYKEKKSDEERREVGGERTEIDEKVQAASDRSKEGLFLYDHKSRLKHRLLTKCGVQTLHIAWFDWPRRCHNQRAALIELLAQQNPGERRQNSSFSQTRHVYPSSLSLSSSSSSFIFSSTSSSSCEEGTNFPSTLSSSCSKQGDRSLSFSCSSSSPSSRNVCGENDEEEKKVEDQEEKDREDEDEEEKGKEEKDKPPLQESCLHVATRDPFPQRPSTLTCNTAAETGPLSLSFSSSFLSGRRNLSLSDKNKKPPDCGDEDTGRRHGNSTDSVQNDSERRDLGGYQALRVYRPMFTRICRSETFSSSLENEEERRFNTFQDHRSLVYDEDQKKDDEERNTLEERESDRYFSSSSSSHYYSYPSELPIFLEND